MRITASTIALLALTAIAYPGNVGAQEDEPLYVAVNCMKVTDTDYESVETDIWQPMHQELVNRGKIESWALYWVRYGDRSRCDYYTVTAYRGQQQLDADADYGELFAAVHPGTNVRKALERTYESRHQVSSALWLTVDSTVMKPHRYAIVNLMQADDPDAYERMESMVFKSAHQGLVNEGHRAGWAVYELISPTGSELPYNYSTVDLVNNLAPAPMAEAMIEANPDRDLEAMHNLLELREHVRSETWALVAATTPRAAE